MTKQWSVEYNPELPEYCVICTLEDGEKYLVADLTTVKEDAYLIAAAPDLLEALEGVIKVADRATIEFDAARAAIAKAKGENVTT